MHKIILIVDSSDSVRQMLGFSLKQAGYDVEEAASAKAALEILEATPASMVITQLELPDLDGIGLIKAIRSGKINRFVPILLLLKESESDRKPEARSAGVTGCIAKPFKPEALLAAVRKVIR